MGKSRRSRSSVVKSITKTASKTLPVVNKGLKTVGSTAKNVASASIPVIEKGVSAVYGTMATGLDLGVKGAKTLAKGMSKGRRAKHRSVSRSRSLAGGRRTRRRRH
jgi:hypothetical protein